MPKQNQFAFSSGSVFVRSKTGLDDNFVSSVQSTTVLTGIVTTRVQEKEKIIIRDNIVKTNLLTIL
ncbi:MAG: hypothetical protein HN548_06070 [Opitutae bacterium]|nr:hypothetical protein [Opitutae bacterium]